MSLPAAVPWRSEGVGVAPGILTSRDRYLFADRREEMSAIICYPFAFYSGGKVKLPFEHFVVIR